MLIAVLAVPLTQAVGRTPAQVAVVVVVVVVKAAAFARSNSIGIMPIGFTPVRECGDGWPEEEEGIRECAPEAVLVVLVPVCSCAGTITLPKWCSLFRELVADAEAEAEAERPEVAAEADEGSGGGEFDSQSSSASTQSGAVAERESAVGSRVASVQCIASVR